MIPHSCGAAQWPASLQAYEYLRTLAPRDWAWEALRRNASYRQQASPPPCEGVERLSLANGALLTRLKSPQTAAEAWALLCFRRPDARRARGAPGLAAAG